MFSKKKKEKSKKDVMKLLKDSGIDVRVGRKSLSSPNHSSVGKGQKGVLRVDD